MDDFSRGDAFEAGKNGKDRRPGLWPPALLLGAIVAVVFLSRIFGVGDRLADLRDWIGTLGVLGPVVFSLAYAGAAVAALPASVLSVAAGALFGPVLGVIVVAIGSTLVASLAFLLSRYAARRSIAAWLEKNERFRRLDDLTAKHGAVIVAITRLVPIFPFNLLNYGFGLTRVSFRTYVLWSALFMLPGTILYVVGSAAVFEAAAEGRVPWLLVSVVILIFGVLTVLARGAKRKLAESEAGMQDKKRGQADE